MTNDNTKKKVGTECHPVIEEYARLASEYERKWSFYVRTTCHETLNRMHVNRTGSILDVGCGTGAMLHELATEYSECNLAGIDPSPEMLSIARHRLPTSVELKQGWAEQIPYSSGSFDTVVSCNMFHYIRQPHEALIEMTRVLRPDGVLIITDWCDDYLACRICDWYLRLFNAAHFRTYRVRECRKFLEDVGANGIQIDRYKITWLWGLMTATAQKREMNTEQRIETLHNAGMYVNSNRRVIRRP